MSAASLSGKSHINALVLTSIHHDAELCSAETAGEVVMLQEATSAVTPPVFDYAGLSKQAIKEAETVANRIRSRLRSNIIDTGQDLLSIKDKLGHGNFGPWLKFYFGMSERTAQNLMRAAEAFHDRPAVVDRMPPAVVYKLAAKSIPEDVRDAIAGDIRRGALLDPQVVMSRIKAARSKSCSAPQTKGNVSDAEFEVLPSEEAAASSPAEQPARGVAVDEGSPENMEATLPAEKFVNKMKEMFGSRFETFRMALLLVLKDADSLRKVLEDG